MSKVKHRNATKRIWILGNLYVACGLTLYALTLFWLDGHGYLAFLGGIAVALGLSQFRHRKSADEHHQYKLQSALERNAEKAIEKILFSTNTDEHWKVIKPHAHVG